MASTSSPPSDPSGQQQQHSSGPTSPEPAAAHIATVALQPKPAKRTYGRRRASPSRSPSPVRDEAAEEEEDVSLPPIPPAGDSDDILDLQRSDGRRRGFSRHPSWSSSLALLLPPAYETPSHPTSRALRSAEPEEGERRDTTSTDEIENSPVRSMGSDADDSGDDDGDGGLRGLLKEPRGKVAGKMGRRSAAATAASSGTSSKRKCLIGRPGTRPSMGRRSASDTGHRRLQLAPEGEQPTPPTTITSTSGDNKKSRLEALVAKRRDTERAERDTEAKRTGGKTKGKDVAQAMMDQLMDDPTEAWPTMADMFKPIEPEQVYEQHRSETSGSKAKDNEQDVNDDESIEQSDSDEGFKAPKRRPRTSKTRASRAKPQGPVKIKPLPKYEQVEMEKETQRLNAENKKLEARKHVQEAQLKRANKTFDLASLVGKMTKSVPSCASTNQSASKVQSKVEPQRSGGINWTTTALARLQDDGHELKHWMSHGLSKPTPATEPERDNDDDEEEDDDIEIVHAAAPTTTLDKGKGKLGKHLFGHSSTGFSFSPLTSTPVASRSRLPLSKEPDLFAVKPKPADVPRTPAPTKLTKLSKQPQTTPNSLVSSLWAKSRQQVRRKNDHTSLVGRGLGPKQDGAQFALPANPFLAPDSQQEQDDASGSEYDPDAPQEEEVLAYSGESEEDEHDEPEPEPEPELELELEPGADDDGDQVDGKEEEEEDQEEQDVTVRLPAPTRKTRRSAVAPYSDSEEEDQPLNPPAILAKQSSQIESQSQSLLLRPHSQSQSYLRSPGQEEVLAQASLPVSEASNVHGTQFSDAPPPAQQRPQQRASTQQPDAGLPPAAQQPGWTQGVLGPATQVAPSDVPHHESSSQDDNSTDVLGNFFLPTQMGTEADESVGNASSGPPAVGETRPSSVLGSQSQVGLSQFFAETQTGDQGGASSGVPSGALDGNGPDDPLAAAFGAPTQTQPGNPFTTRSPASATPANDAFAALRAGQQALPLSQLNDVLPAVATAEAERYEAEAEEAEKQRVWAERRAMLDKPKMYMNKHGLYTQTKPADDEADSDSDDGMGPPLDDTIDSMPLPTLASPDRSNSRVERDQTSADGNHSMDRVPERKSRFRLGGAPTPKLVEAEQSDGSDKHEDENHGGSESDTNGSDAVDEEPTKKRSALDMLMHQAKHPEQPKEKRKKLKRSAFIEGEAAESEPDDEPSTKDGRRTVMAGVWSDQSDNEGADAEGEDGDSDSDDDGADLAELVNNEHEVDEATKDALVTEKARKDQKEADDEQLKLAQKVAEGKWRAKHDAQSKFGAALDEDADDARDRYLAAQPNAGAVRGKRNVEADSLEALAKVPGASAFLSTYEHGHSNVQGDDMDFLVPADTGSDDEDAGSVDGDDDGHADSEEAPLEFKDIQREIQARRKAERARKRQGLASDDEGSDAEGAEADGDLSYRSANKRRRVDPLDRMLGLDSDEDEPRFDAPQRTSALQAHVPDPDDFAMAIPTTTTREVDQDTPVMFGHGGGSNVARSNTTAVTSLGKPKVAVSAALKAKSLGVKGGAAPKAVPASALGSIAHRMGKFED